MAAVNEIQMLALEAEKFLSPRPSDRPQGVRLTQRLSRLWNPPSKPLELNWNDASVLAFSFGQVWDTKRAENYYKRAADLAANHREVGPAAEIFARRNMGIFYYQGNSESDLRSARDAFDEAAGVLKPEVNGADFTYDKNYETRFIQAMQENALGHTAQAAKYLHAAWDWSTKVEALWRRRRATDQIVSLVLSGDPSRFDAYGGLAQEVKERVQGQQQQEADDQQQVRNEAYVQGVIAAQHAFFGQGSQLPSDSSVPGVPGDSQPS